MEKFSVGDIVLVRFPFSDLSQQKLRPALGLADVQRGDCILCRITSQPYHDQRAIIDGIPALGPGECRKIDWGQYNGLMAALGNEPIVATCKFRE